MDTNEDGDLKTEVTSNGELSPVVPFLPNGDVNSHQFPWRNLPTEAGSLLPSTDAYANAAQFYISKQFDKDYICGKPKRDDSRKFAYPGFGGPWSKLSDSSRLLLTPDHTWSGLAFSSTPPLAASSSQTKTDVSEYDEFDAFVAAAVQLTDDTIQDCTSHLVPVEDQEIYQRTITQMNVTPPVKSLSRGMQLAKYHWPLQSDDLMDEGKENVDQEDDVPSGPDYENTIDCLMEYFNHPEPWDKDAIVPSVPKLPGTVGAQLRVLLKGLRKKRYDQITAPKHSRPEEQVAKQIHKTQRFGREIETKRDAKQLLPANVETHERLDQRIKEKRAADEIKKRELQRRMPPPGMAQRRIIRRAGAVTNAQMQSDRWKRRRAIDFIETEGQKRERERKERELKIRRTQEMRRQQDEANRLRNSFVTKNMENDRTYQQTMMSNQAKILAKYLTSEGNDRDNEEDMIIETIKAKPDRDHSFVDKFFKRRTPDTTLCDVLNFINFKDYTIYTTYSKEQHFRELFKNLTVKTTRILRQQQLVVVDDEKSRRRPRFAGRGRHRQFTNFSTYHDGFKVHDDSLKGGETTQEKKKSTVAQVDAELNQVQVALNDEASCQIRNCEHLFVFATRSPYGDQNSARSDLLRAKVPLLWDANVPFMKKNGFVRYLMVTMEFRGDSDHRLDRIVDAANAFTP